MDCTFGRLMVTVVPRVMMSIIVSRSVTSPSKRLPSLVITTPGLARTTEATITAIPHRKPCQTRIVVSPRRAYRKDREAGRQVIGRQPPFSGCGRFYAGCPADMMAGDRR